MEYNINKLVEDMNFDLLSLVSCPNGLLLTNKEIAVLKRYEIDYHTCASLKEILFKIEEFFSYCDDDLEDLEEISQSIAERDYYQNTNK